VKVNKVLQSGWLLSVIVAVVLAICLQAFAQLEELEPLGQKEETPCVPESLNTVYDQFKSDSLGPQQLGIWYSLAREEFKYKNYERAIPYYWKVLVNDTTGRFKIVYTKLAECYYNLNQPDSVLIVCYRGLEKYPDQVRLHYYAGVIYDIMGRPTCAIPHYESLVKDSPKEKSYWAKLAYLYYKIDDPKAIDAQRKVVELDPSDVEASRLLAEIMQHFGEDPLLARKDTWLKDPSNIENAKTYGVAAFERGLYKDALEPFEAILKKEPKNTMAMEYLGRSYEGLNQLRKALGYYREILQIEPRNVNVLCLTASVYGRLHEFTTARRYVQNAERVDPGNGLPHMIMAEIYENAVTYCTDQRNDQKITYDDKLVYEMAQNELKKATNDTNYANEAKRRIAQFEPLVPTAEDKFMHKNRSNTVEPCYSWISQ
jgi:tetratricopeptide (TPR) repeat protein